MEFAQRIDAGHDATDQPSHPRLICQLLQSFSGGQLPNSRGIDGDDVIQGEVATIPEVMGNRKISQYRVCTLLAVGSRGCLKLLDEGTDS